MRAWKCPALVALAPLAFLVLLGCGEPEQPSFAIHDGDLRPDCTSNTRDGRTDLVSPDTVDTVQWSAPRKVGAPVNTECPQDDPEISPDGQVLYFYWSPDLAGKLTAEEQLLGTTGVYCARRIGGPGEFNAPRFFDLRKGTDGALDGHPRLTPSGDRVYFHSTRAENTGYQLSPVVDDPMDIYVAAIEDGIPAAAENLGSTVNSAALDGEVAISPDGQTLFLSSNRAGGLGDSDIYYSQVADGAFTTPTNIGAPINSVGADKQPAFSADDPDTMYFVSDRDGIGAAIYRSRRNGSTWETPVLVIQGQVGSPSLTADGGTMYFVHVLTDDRAGDPVFGADIYYVAALP